MIFLVFLAFSVPSTFGNIIELDSSNFDSIAMDPSKNVLVEFYSQNCGVCKGLAPIYEKVAQAFENEPSCTVAKVDAGTYKELGERFSVPGYPTIKLFSNTDKSGENYSGGRGEQDFIDFLNTRCNARRTSGGGTLP